ncbi:MAG: hypothetical protein ACKVVP_22175, partial [Chloroflexota bacterium]
MIASPAPLSGSVPALDGAERRRIQLSEIVLIRAGLALVLLIAAALRLSGLDQDSLWYDEIFGLTLAQQPFAVVLEVIGGFVANMALYLVLMHVWMA